jgi:hypothetical protein
MKPAPFPYHRARIAREAVDMLAAAGDEGSVPVREGVRQWS